MLASSKILGKQVWLHVIATLFAISCKVARFAPFCKNVFLECWYGGNVCNICTIFQNLLLAKLAICANFGKIALQDWQNVLRSCTRLPRIFLTNTQWLICFLLCTNFTKKKQTLFECFQFPFNDVSKIIDTGVVQCQNQF